MLQSSIKGLRYANDGRSTHWGDYMSPGCLSCRANRWVTVLIGKACNASCSFCPQATKPAKESPEDEDGWISTSFGHERYDGLQEKLASAALRESIAALGYSGGEPLMYLDRIEDFAGTLNDQCPSLYQYLYTNGILLNEAVATQLVAVDVKEIRFDLAATEFAPKIIRKLGGCLKRHKLYRKFPHGHFIWYLIITELSEKQAT